MITCEEIYGLHTSKTPESAIHAAYRDIPLDSRNGMRKNATPLHMACTFADEEAVRILLERGADVNVKNDDGDTPLCVLAKHNYCRQEAAFAEIAGLLLSKGARILRSGKNTTALIEAVRNRHFLMADALLMSGNRIDSADSNGDNVLHAICQSAGDIAYDIKRTEERIADFSERWYPERDKRETGEKLENLREADKLCFSTAKRILENGQIDPEDKNNIGKTAFDIAMEEGARRIGALLSGQDPETDELSALAGGLNVFQALWYKDMAALDAILRSGVELQTICEDEKLHDFKGKSPLACALSWDNAEAAEILLRSGADPDFRDSEERTAFAVWLKKRKQGSEKKEECLHLLRCLMQCGWHPENPADKEGNTSLSLACREAGYELGNWAVRYLVENGADVNAVNLQGQTPAMNLYGGRFWVGNIPCFAVLPRSYPYGGRCCTEEDADILEVLLEAGADINAKDKWGNTLLHYIAGSSQRGAKEAVGLVMDFGKPDVNAVNNEGKTALDIATEKNDESLVKFLLKYD